MSIIVIWNLISIKSFLMKYILIKNASDNLNQTKWFYCNTYIIIVFKFSFINIVIAKTIELQPKITIIV